MAQWEQKNIYEVVQDINDSTIVLPVIQRKLVWDEEQMELLFDSLLKGNSFGGIMALKEVKGSKPLFAFRRFSKEGEPLDAYPVPVLDQNISLIIDGQQRLQTFYMGLMGSASGKNLYFNLFSQGDYDFVFAQQISDLPIVKHEDGYEVPMLWYHVTTLYSQLSRVNDELKVAKEIINTRDILDEKFKDLIKENVMLFYREIFREKNIGISYVIIDKDNHDVERQRMVELFRRLNAGGTFLSASDLAASFFLSFDYRLEKFFRRDIPEFENLGFRQDEAVKLLFLLQDNNTKEATDITKDDADFAVANTDRILKTLSVLRQLLKYVKLYEYFHDGGRSVIPLYFIAYHIFHNPRATDALSGLYDNFDANNPDFTNIKRWLYLSLLNGVFRKGKGWIPYRTGINKILKVVSQYKGNLFPTDQIFSMYEEHPLVFNRELTERRLPQWDMSFVFYLIYGDRSLGSRDIDHIQPKSKLEGARFPPEKIHSISNYQLLDEGTNRTEKRASELKVWLENWGEAERSQYLATHLNPQAPDLWRLERFDEFLTARTKLIIEKIQSSVPQKSVVVEAKTPSPTPPVSPVGQPSPVEYDREALKLSLPDELQSHPILSDSTTWADYFIKNKIGGPQWSHRISRELAFAGINTVADMALLIMTLGLRVSHKNDWGNFYVFDRSLSNGQKPTMRTKHVGPWSWRMILERLQRGGFDWNKYVAK